MGQVLVLDYEEPVQRLMGWFLKDSGLDVVEVDELDEAVETIRTNPMRAIVVNSTAPLEQIAKIVDTLRGTAADARLIVMHRGVHQEGGVELAADLCIHSPDDPEWLVQAVRAAITDDLPDAEPHKAAKDLG
jgi:DNA-binding response OmpR family regulator